MNRPDVSLDHDRWADAVAPYLLGALPEDEHAPFEAHLASCAICADEADRLRVAVEALPASPRQMAPPPELKGRIMSIVRSEAELLRAAGPEADRVAAPAPPRRGWAVLRPGWLAVRPGLALGAAAAVLAVGVGTGLVLDDGPGAPQRTVVAQVDPKVATTGGHAKLIVREGHSVLVADRLPKPGAGRVYQVWLKRDGEDPRPTNALFSVRADGSASVDVPGKLEDVDQVLVTSEPDGGSQAPTRQPIINAVLS